MTRLPASILFWSFIPGRGVVRAVCEPTTSDTTAAEVGAAMCESDASWMKRPIAYQPEIQRRLDEAADDALADIVRGVTLGDADALSLRRANDAEDRFLCRRYTHPEDATLPAWME